VAGVVVTTTFLGPVGLWRAMTRADYVLIEACEHYQKRSYRHRSYVMGPNGVQLLSVPLASGKHSGQSIKDVLISYEHDWVGPMLHTLRSALGSAAYYDYYYDDLADILRGRHETLWSLNEACTQFIIKSIGLTLDLRETTTYQKSYEVESDLRSYQLKPAPSDAAGYEQVWSDRHGYWDNLSVVDLLFCLGPESVLYLTS
jgi:hypothetical protein